MTGDCDAVVVVDEAAEVAFLVRELTGPVRLSGSLVMKGCDTAWSGRRRFSGSQRRHWERKSRNASSSHLMAPLRVLLLGRLLLPLLETVTRGLRDESKNSFLLDAFSIISRAGGPKISMIHASCSCSFSPGKMGYPVNSSAKIQPMLHMSIGIP